MDRTASRHHLRLARPRAAAPAPWRAALLLGAIVARVRLVWTQTAACAGAALALAPLLARRPAPADRAARVIALEPRRRAAPT